MPCPIRTIGFNIIKSARRETICKIRSAVKCVQIIARISEVCERGMEGSTRRPDWTLRNINKWEKG